MNSIPNKKILLIIGLIFTFQWAFPQYSLAHTIMKTDLSTSILAKNKQILIKEKADNLAKLPQSDWKEPVKTMKVMASAYSSTVDQTDSTPFITANGKHVADGIVAANFLPFGTKIKIPELYGDKIFSVEDRMNPRYYYKIDIWMETREEAIQFGVQYIEIEIF